MNNNATHGNDTNILRRFKLYGICIISLGSICALYIYRDMERVEKERDAFRLIDYAWDYKVCVHSTLACLFTVPTYHFNIRFF